MTAESPEIAAKKQKKKLTDKQRSRLWELSAFFIFILVGLFSLATLLAGGRPSLGKIIYGSFFP
jgi:hypothetical protein